MRRVIGVIMAATLSMIVGTSTAVAAPEDVFDSIDGGSIRLDDFAGRPVLVVNTASMCAFTPQYDALQGLYDTYRDQGLVVLAIPSDDFAQELETDEEVKAFCGMVFGLDIPMTTITTITGQDAHPFFVRLREDEGFVPAWNFNKVLLDRSGAVVETYGSMVTPTSRVIVRDIEAILAAPG